MSKISCTEHICAWVGTLLSTPALSPPWQAPLSQSRLLPLSINYSYFTSFPLHWGLMG